MINLILGGILGMLLYTLIKARNHLDKRFDFQKLLRENLPSWVLSVITIVVCAIIVSIEPDSLSGLYDAIGVTFEPSFKGFLILGTFLAFGSKEASKKSKK